MSSFRFRQVVLAAFAAVSFGCKSTSETPSEATPTASVPAPFRWADGGATVSIEAGSLALGPAATVPDDFPAAIPIYPGISAELVSRTRSPRGKVTWSLSLQSSDPASAVAAFYATKMTGFTKVSELQAGATQMTAWRSSRLEVSVVVAPADGGPTSVILTATER